MKTSLKINFFIPMFFGVFFSLNAQEKASVAVLNFDVQKIDISSEQMGNLVRIELEKLNLMEVVDRYDIRFVSEKNQINLNNCFGKTCMLEMGNHLKADKVISGSCELFGDHMILTIRMVDVATGRMEKSIVKQYLHLSKELPIMTEMALKEMFGQEVDLLVQEKLTKKSSFESSINNPNDDYLKLNGPRMGFTVLTGTNAKIISAATNKGGFNAYPMMSQFGYQFEKKYLNEGNYQALVEVIPMVTGIDQGLFLPSIVIMNGLRNNVNGLEFAIGPTFGFSTRSRGFINAQGEWVKLENQIEVPENADIEYRLDSKGTPYLNSGLVLAAGKTIKSGKLNIPLNMYAVPGKNGWRFGFSFGFNARSDKKS